MGTERSVEFEGPCLCGKGRFEIDDCAVDHGWPTSRPQWYEPRINCPACRERFDLQKRGKAFVLVEQVNLRERRAREEAVDRMAKRIMAHLEMEAVVAQLAAMLEAQPSVAAKFRLLRGAGLEDGTEGTFRRHWQGAGTWIRRTMRVALLERAFELVGASIEPIAPMLNELQQLEALAKEEPPAFGQPVHVLE